MKGVGDRKSKVFRVIFLSCIVVLLQACVEPFDAQTLTFESALVIDATITNESKVQEISLRRSYALEADGPAMERNATVTVVDDQGGVLNFIENEPGIYRSEQAFAAREGIGYTLNVTTADSRSYTSTPVTLSPIAELEEVYAVRETNENGVEGVAIKVIGSGTAENAGNYRFIFEESYKVIAPFWTNQMLVPDPDVHCGVLVERRIREEQTCYGRQKSNSIILANTNEFTEDRVQDFTVRFIRRDNYIISHRYSILVHQLVQSPEVYAFYETLRDFSGPESLFSESQPGFLQGNVYSEENQEEKVLGYFDVASVSSRRIFFDYDDLFPGEDLPPYAEPCPQFAPPLFGRASGAPPPPPCDLVNRLEFNILRYWRENNGPEIIGEGGPYVVVPRICGDCTVLGSTEVPEFWIEE